MIVNRCLLYVFVRVELRFPLYLPPTAVLGTAFAIFLICRLSLRYTCDRICNFSHLQIIPALYLWPHFLFFAFVDYLLLYTCDRIRNFSHLQIISCSILVTAFALFSICRLSSPPNQWLHSQLFSFVDYLCSILVTAFAIFPIWRLSSAPHLPYDCVWGCLQAGLSPQEACFPPPFC